MTKIYFSKLVKTSKLMILAIIIMHLYHLSLKIVRIKKKNVDNFRIKDRKLKKLCFWKKNIPIINQTKKSKYI